MLGVMTALSDKRYTHHHTVQSRKAMFYPFVVLEYTVSRARSVGELGGGPEIRSEWDISIQYRLSKSMHNIARCGAAAQEASS